MTKLLTGDSDELLEISIPEQNKTSTKGQTPSAMSVDGILSCSELSTLLTCVELEDERKREAAVIQLGMLNDPVVIPNLIERVDDVVAEIRSAAKSALRKLAVPENADVFVMSLPEVYHLRKSEREDHNDFIHKIENYLIQPTNVLKILEGLNDSDTKVANACFALVLKYKLADIDTFIMSALKHKDLSIRIKASHLINSLEEDTKKEALNLALKDAYMPIRRDAFLSLMQVWGNEGLAKTMLFDEHAGIREIAVAHLTKMGEDVQYTYLRSLSEEDPKVLCASLWGIGFLKVAECSTLVKPFLQHEVPEVSEQAQATLDTLDKLPEKFTDTVEWNSIDTQF